MWNEPETAPKDGTLIIADLGYAWPCVACWNPLEQEWIWANLQVSVVDGKHDTYFDTEYEKPEELKRWKPLPVLD